MWAKIKDFLFRNKTPGQTVAKNSIWLSISNFGGRIIKAVIVIYGARVLGTAQWGVFSYATTLAAFFTLFMDPGVNAIMMRDLSKTSEEERTTFFSTTIVMKIFLLVTGVVFVLVAAPYFSTLPGAKALIPLAALIIVCDTTREFFSAFMRSMEKMEWEAAVFLLTNAAIVVLGFVFLALHPTAHSFAWAYAAGAAIGAIAAIFAVRRYIKNILEHFSSKLILPIFRSAWPFAVTGALGLLLTSSDILIISWMRSASDVGIYAAAIRIIQVLYLIPMVLQFSTLPLFGRLAGRDDQKFRDTFERILGIIFLASVPLALGGAILGTEIMRLVFGPAYAAGGLSFRILMLSMLVDFPAALVSNAIFAYDHQKSLIICSAIGGIGNVVFDLLFIPIWGIAGSAVATLLAQTLSNGYLWHRMNTINHFRVLPRLKNVVIAGVIMACVTLILMLLGTEVVVNIALSAIAYFLVLRILREPLLIDTKRIVLGGVSA